MKVLFVAVALLALLPSFESKAVTYNVIEDKIRQMLEDLREALRNGIPELQVPPMDPWNVDAFDLVFNFNEIGNFTMQLQDSTIRGITSYILEYLKFNIVGFKIGMNFTFPLIHLEGRYNLDWNYILGSMVIYGNGPYTIDVGNLVVNIDTKLNFDSEQKLFSLDYLNLYLHMDSLKTDMRNIFDEDGDITEIINTVISDAFPKVLDEEWPNLEPNVTAIIKEQANYYLEEYKEYIYDLIFGS